MAGELSTGKRRRVGDTTDKRTCTYEAQRILGRGSFGVVYQAQILETSEIVAIKSIGFELNDREVCVLRELEGHPNIVNLKGTFMSMDSGRRMVNLVLEFLSDTVHRIIKHMNTLGKRIDHYYVRLYSYQLARALLFVHGRGIVHCDIKPQNLLLDGKSHTLKLCDFGTAKRKNYDDVLTAYVCSRYYRAPELVLGAVDYTTSIDLFSAGCVYAELLLGQPLFTGKDGIFQLVEMIKVLGTPTPQEVQAMNPLYPAFEFSPKLEPFSWDTVFRGCAPPEACDLIGQLVRYNPETRLPPVQVLLHPFYDPLRNEEKPAHRRLFDFSPGELWICKPSEKERLVPAWFASSTRAKNGKTS